MKRFSVIAGSSVIAGIILLAAVKAQDWLSSSTQSSPAQDGTEVELITVRPYGFEPATIGRPHGKFVLMIDNRSKLADISVRLDRVQGGRLKEVPMQKGRVNWFEHQNLPPGDYLLTEANHPAWVCRITLTPN